MITGTKEKNEPTPVPLRASQTPHRLPWGKTKVTTAMRNRRLTPWATSALFSELSLTIYFWNDEPRVQNVVSLLFRLSHIRSLSVISPFGPAGEAAANAYADCHASLYVRQISDKVKICKRKQTNISKCLYHCQQFINWNSWGVWH